MKYSIARNFLSFALIAGGLLCAAGVAHAQVVIFDNLANTPQGFSSVTDTQWQAQKFNTDSNNVMLTRAVLKLYSETGGSGTFFLRLFSDAAGQPGTSLATLAGGPNPLTGGFPQQADVVFGGLSQPLLPNTNYWMVFGDNAGPPLDLRWGVANSAGSGSGFQAINAVGSQAAGWTVSTGNAQQMQLTVSPIPEPASMLLGLLGSGGLLLVRRRKIARHCHHGI